MDLSIHRLNPTPFHLLVCSGHLRRRRLRRLSLLAGTHCRDPVPPRYLREPPLQAFRHQFRLLARRSADNRRVTRGLEIK